jgi:hypothetical protein
VLQVRELRREGCDFISMFAVHDTHRLGMIAHRDFVDVLRRLRLPLSSAAVEQTVRRYTCTGDSNLVCYDEFARDLNSTADDPTLVRTHGACDTLKSAPQIDGDGFDGLRASVESAFGGDPLASSARTEVSCVTLV